MIDLKNLGRYNHSFKYQRKCATIIDLKKQFVLNTFYDANWNETTCHKLIIIFY